MRSVDARGDKAARDALRAIGPGANAPRTPSSAPAAALKLNQSEGEGRRPWRTHELDSTLQRSTLNLTLGQRASSSSFSTHELINGALQQAQVQRHEAGERLVGGTLGLRNAAPQPQRAPHHLRPQPGRSASRLKRRGWDVGGNRSARRTTCGNTPGRSATEVTGAREVTGKCSTTRQVLSPSVPSISTLLGAGLAASSPHGTRKRNEERHARVRAPDPPLKPSPSQGPSPASWRCRRLRRPSGSPPEAPPPGTCRPASAPPQTAAAPAPPRSGPPPLPPSSPSSSPSSCPRPFSSSPSFPSRRRCWARHPPRRRRPRPRLTRRKRRRRARARRRRRRRRQRRRRRHRAPAPWRAPLARRRRCSGGPARGRCGGGWGGRRRARSAWRRRGAPAERGEGEEGGARDAGRIHVMRAPGGRGGGACSPRAMGRLRLPCGLARPPPPWRAGSFSPAP